MRRGLLCLLCAAGSAWGAAPAHEQRAASPAEIASFNEYFQHRLADSGGPPALMLAPVLDAQRDAGGRRGPGPWQLGAQVDTKPRHMAVGLCHLQRSRFRYDAAARAGQRWSEDGTATEYVWSSGGPVPCGAPPQLVQLREPLPTADVLGLLEQQATLLSRARLLFAGNTSCARQRAYQFSLDAIAGAAPQAGASAMYQLTYRSDRATTARITVRKKGPELTAWNVSCVER